MPREDKSKHTDKQMHLAGDIELSNAPRTDSKKEAGRRAWSTEIKNPQLARRAVLDAAYIVQGIIYPDDLTHR